ncbi:hypothetical protein H2198_000660 [Neophaeococcomyces mojaviensis]|uniref:Uncharacterized protein n=1 Tax=Neophaeococcomyces mojaviensis TaxID=3383035 RepID=A0ACC3AJA8_9EURO|nr:hypothetical protein H2198_000660 [Knufia sp. JES_112]
MQNGYNGDTMKAVRFHPPGGPDKLAFATEPKPTLKKPGEVLIKVRAVGLIWTELYWPIYQNSDGTYRSHIPGHDFSGVITEIAAGTGSGELQVGSEVYVFTSRRNHEGAMAEFAVADIDQVLPKPSSLSLIEAASVPLSALTAWQALFDHGKLQKGQKLLINGAAGGTGIWAVQFAKMVGAHVFGTGSSKRSHEILEGFGIDEFIDYKATSVIDVVKDVDLILDCVGGQALEQSFQVVKDEGLVISILTLQCAELARKQGKTGMFFIVSMRAEQLVQITKLIEDKGIKPIVDKVVPLEQARSAFEEAANGHVHGKIIIGV